MKISKVYVEIGFTKALPNYQNVKPVAGVEITLAANDSVDAAFQKAWDIASDEVNRAVATMVPNSPQPELIKRGF